MVRREVFTGAGLDLVVLSLGQVLEGPGSVMVAFLQHSNALTITNSYTFRRNL